mmetsp:Transcript_22188/g.60662  ORF Transcript_22188/g.60662 Transcript_22188/m.60662 type:complete len:234 (-) Transcript_22188:363-1064(-)
MPRSWRSPTPPSASPRPARGAGQSPLRAPGPPPPLPSQWPPRPAAAVAASNGAPPGDAHRRTPPRRIARPAAGGGRAWCGSSLAAAAAPRRRARTSRRCPSGSGPPSGSCTSWSCGKCSSAPGPAACLRHQTRPRCPRASRECCPSGRPRRARARPHGWHRRACSPWTSLGGKAGNSPRGWLPWSTSTRSSRRACQAPSSRGVPRPCSAARRRAMPLQKALRPPRPPPPPRAL